MEAHNRRFGREPFRDRDAHRPMSEGDDLTEIFAWKEERTVSMNLTLQYDQTLFILEPNEVTRPLARQRVTVFDYPDGRLAIKHQGASFPTASSISASRSIKPQSWRTSGWDPSWPISPNARRSWT